VLCMKLMTAHPVSLKDLLDKNKLLQHTLAHVYAILSSNKIMT
jgi:hypothetical protein